MSFALQKKKGAFYMIEETGDSMLGGVVERGSWIDAKSPMHLPTNG
jgi:hypothetical protein